MYRVYAHEPRGAHQPRHPPPPRAAARQRPPQDRADERAAVLAAGHARHLLRRRDRDGRQHLPRRPQRRAHADAVERRPQRRLLARQPAAALPAADHRPRVPLRDRQRRGPAEQPELAAVVDAAAARAAQALPGVRARRRSSSSTPRTGACWPSCARDDERIVLVVANLSRFAQYVELDLSQLPRRRCRSSCSARRRFPPIGDLPYLLTLGPHAFYWLALEGQREEAGAIASDGSAPSLRRRRRAGGDRHRAQPRRARAGPGAVPAQRGAGSPARRGASATVSVRDTLPHRGPARRAGGPGADRRTSSSGRARARPTPSRWRWWRASAPSGWRSTRRAASWPHLQATATSPRCWPRPCSTRTSAAPCSTRSRRRRRLKGSSGGQLVGRADRRAGARPSHGDEPPDPSIFRAEQSNTSVLFGQSLILKLFRRVEPGREPRPRARPLSGRARGLRAHARRRRRARVPRRRRRAGDARDPPRVRPERGRRVAVHARRAEPFLRGGASPSGSSRARTRRPRGRAGSSTARERPMPEEIDELVGSYLQSAALMGRRIAELHSALSARRGRPGLAPEPFTPHYQRSALPVDAQPHRQLDAAPAAAACPALGERERAAAERVLARRATS